MDARKITRRRFLQMAALLSATMAWPREALAEVASGLSQLATGTAPLIWLGGQGCSGCSVSFLNAVYPDPAAVLTRYISLEFHPVISAASGSVALGAMEQRLAAGGYVLVVEGAVPLGMPDACRVGDEPFGELVARAALNATAVVAVGNCAAFGGIPAAPPNPTGAVSVSQCLERIKGSKAVINLPGCPIHPDWLVGTVVQLLRYGAPALTPQGCPEGIFGSELHAHCPQFYNYDAGKFARFFGDEGCLFELGCMGTRTNADCPSRRWNNKVNWCVEAGAPCIGCARPEFAQSREFPFYRISENSKASAGMETRPTAAAGG